MAGASGLDPGPAAASVNGVISIAAAHRGGTIKMNDQTRARSDWQHVIAGLKPGAKVVLMNFADDAYDVGGRMDDARSTFAKSGIDAVIIDSPAGFIGHGAGGTTEFARKFGPCVQSFISMDRIRRPAPYSRATSGTAQLGSCPTDATHGGRPGAPFVCFRYAGTRKIAPAVIAER